MTTKITNAKLVLCDADNTVIERGEILFDENQILAIGQDLGAADRIVDVGGKTVLPGFIDCHVHPAGVKVCDETTTALYAYSGTMELLKSGITTVRTVGTKHNADVALRNLIESGSVVGPRIKAAGEVICITCGHGAEMGMECDP